MTLLIAAILSYLLGAVPFGLVFTRLFGLGDIRSIGSGNIGVTNVLRTGHKGAALLTLIFDVGKGAIAVVATRAILGEPAAQIAGVTAFVGHVFPVYLGFRGGKGVATFLGTALALAWPVGLIAIGAWIATAVITRISSASALVAAITSPLVALAFGVPQTAIALAAKAAVIVYRHRENIARLRAGTEPRIGRR